MRPSATRARLHLGALFLLFAATAAPVTAQHTTVVSADVPLENLNLGLAVVVDGDRMVVGGLDVAFVFRRSGGGWVQEARLSAPTSSTGSYTFFGRAVSISGDYIAVGAYLEDVVSDLNSQDGAVYVFRWDGAEWVQEAKLGGKNGEHFGESVLLSGDALFVGSPNARSVRVFQRSGTSWTEGAAVVSPSGFNGSFGSSLAVDGGYLIIGAPQDYDTDLQIAPGAAFVYYWDGTAWTQETKLVPTDPVQSLQFGRAVSISGDDIVVGTADGSIEAVGTAYVFRRSAAAAWEPLAKLTASDGKPRDSFGYEVAIEGDHILVGARSGRSDVEPLQEARGTAYLFHKSDSSYSEVVRYAPAELAANSSFGLGVAFGSDFVAVGAPGNTDEGVTRSGSVYVFESGLVAETQPLAFPTLDVGEKDTLRTALRVGGIAPLTVSAVSVADDAFEVDFPIPFTLAPGADQELSVAFAPPGAGEYDAYVVFEHDGPGGRDSVRVQGSAQLRAQLAGFGTQTVPSNFVNVVFRATDAAGRGLDIPADYVARNVDLFRVFDNGQEMSPTAPESFYQVLKLDQVPYRLRTVLLIDNSTSVANDLPQIQEAARMVVDNLAPNQEVALYVFSSSVQLLQDYTGDRDSLYAAIDGITLGGPSTALYTSLQEGLTRWEDFFLLTEVGPGQIDVDIERGYLVVLSDGDDTAGGATLNDVLSARGNRRVFSVGYGAVNTSVLQELGNAGFYPVGTAADLPGAFAEIQAEIENDARSFYWLNYSSPRRAAQDWALQVCLRDNVFIDSGACAQTAYNSTGFTDPARGVYVNRTMERLLGETEVEVNPSGVTLTATTILGVNAPEYEWTSSDESQVTVTPVAGTNTAVATRVGPVGGTATITLRDAANGLTTTLNATNAVPAEDGPGLGSFAVRGVYPNPARDRVHVDFEVASDALVGAGVYDLLGRLVAEMPATPTLPGSHRTSYDVRGLAPGVYVVRVTAGDEVSVQRFTVVR